MPNESEDELAQLRAEKKRVRAEVYDLGMRLNAGETGVRAALNAAIRRSDELEAEILRLTPAPEPADEYEPAPMYGGPVVPFDPPRPPVVRPGPVPVGPAKRRGFFEWLFRK